MLQCIIEQQAIGTATDGAKGRGMAAWMYPSGGSAGEKEGKSP